MRKHLKIATFATALAASLVFVAPPAEAGGSFGVHIGSSGFGVSVGIGDWGPYTNSWANPQFSLDFNAALSGYGEWVWAGDLGRVWRPWVAVGWRPYTHGRWVRTTLGWTWVAYEPWGYVPHHYGSWAMCDFGWVWVPGYSYVSANVVWVRSGGYVGWYARPPWGWSHAARGYRHGYRDGYRDGWHDARYATYVDWHHLGSDNVSHYAVRHTAVSRSRIQDHASAPTADEARRRGGASVAEASISQRTVTMNGRQVTVARPDGVARSIEHHASRTAAEALSPRALERRQPSIRPVSSAAPAESRVRASSQEISSDRQPLNAGGSRSPRQPAQRSSAATVDARPSGRLESNESLHGGQFRQSPERAPSGGSWHDDQPLDSSASSGGGASSNSIGPRRNTISPRTTRGSSVGSSTRPVIKPSSRSGSTVDRSVVRSGSSAGPHSARTSGRATPSHPETGRSTRPSQSAAGDNASGRTNAGARRRVAPRDDQKADAAEKPVPRSQRIKKR